LIAAGCDRDRARARPHDTARFFYGAIHRSFHPAMPTFSRTLGAIYRYPKKPYSQLMNEY
jgi:hypothetical protein